MDEHPAHPQGGRTRAGVYLVFADGPGGLGQRRWRRKKGTVNPCGLYDLQRRERPVAQAYRDLLNAFGKITIVPKGEMFEVTGEPAMLKVEV